jgi:hypothetical protein
MRTATRICGLAFFCISSIAQADPLVQTLPADGSWISYSAIIKTEGVEHPFTWIVRSVGRKTVNDEPYRWIELYAKRGEESVLFKLLIAEKEFGKGKNPLAKITKGWTGRNEEKPNKEISSISEADPVLAILLEGPTTEIKKREKKEPIKCQNGQFESDVFEGRNTSEFSGITLEVSHTIWKHDQVPFGVTAMKQSMILNFRAGIKSASIDMTLKEFGDMAKSAFPELE